MTIAVEDLARLMDMFKASDWNELHVETAGMQLFLSKDPNATLSGSPKRAPVSTEKVAEVPTVPVVHPSSSAPSSTVNVPYPSEESISDSWVPVVAPNLGTFYRSPKPGAAPFVELGQTVSENKEVCLIEVMKLFTSVVAGVSGVIRKVCAEDAELVEGGQVLFYVERN